MRINEIIVEQELDELDWKKAIATGALGLGLATGSGEASAEAPKDNAAYTQAVNSTATLAALGKAGVLSKVLSSEQIKNLKTWQGQLKADPRYTKVNSNPSRGAGEDVAQEYIRSKGAKLDVLKHTAQASYNEVAQAIGAKR